MLLIQRHWHTHPNYLSISCQFPVMNKSSIDIFPSVSSGWVRDSGRAFMHHHDTFITFYFLSLWWGRTRLERIINSLFDCSCRIITSLNTTMAGSWFRQLCLLILTPACYDQFFVEFNFLHGMHTNYSFSCYCYEGFYYCGMDVLVFFIYLFNGTSSNVASSASEWRLDYAYQFILGVPGLSIYL